MTKPNEAHQKWIDDNPCAMCGKPLNKPFGRERSHAQCISLKYYGSSGSRTTHNKANELPRQINIGLCCIDKLTQGLSR